MHDRHRTLRRNAKIALLSASAIILPTLASTVAQAALVISAGATSNVTCTKRNVCSATSGDAVLNVAQLQNLLTGTSVKVKSGRHAATIDVASSLTWASSNSLTLDAYESITVNQSVSVAGQGGLGLITNDSGTGGSLSFGRKGSISFMGPGHRLLINSSAYTLVNNIATLASDIAAAPNGDYALAADYNAKSDGIYKTAPIPTTFAGAIEGLGNTISDLRINDPVANSSVGLLSQTTTGAIIENLRLSRLRVMGGGKLGGLVGYNDGGSLYGDSVNGVVDDSISGQNSAGGLVGSDDYGTIASSSSSATVTGSGELGGLVGEAYDTEIDKCDAAGRVNSSGGGEAGGLVGDNYWDGNKGGTISNSYATGSITGSGGISVGGLVGYNFFGSSVTSFATGSVTETDGGVVGGLVGYQDSGTLANSYATGAVTGGTNSDDGGLIGYEAGHSVGSSYSTGSVTGGSGSYVGGSVGLDSVQYVVSDVYWNTTSSGITNLSQGAGNISDASGIAGLTTAQLQSGLPTGYDPAIWAESHRINGGLPYLLSNPPP